MYSYVLRYKIEGKLEVVKEIVMSKKTECSAIEAARRLGINLDYLYRLLLTGRIQGRKQDGRWVVTRKAVEAKLKAMWEREMAPHKCRLRYPDGTLFRPRPGAIYASPDEVIAKPLDNPKSSFKAWLRKREKNNG